MKRLIEDMAEELSRRLGMELRIDSVRPGHNRVYRLVRVVDEETGAIVPLTGWYRHDKLKAAMQLALLVLDLKRC